MSVEDVAASPLAAPLALVHNGGPIRPAAATTQSAGEQRRAALLMGPILPTLLRLALPTVTVLVAQTAVNIAEAYYVGYLGTDALAGAALVFPIFMLMTMMSNGGFGSGVASSVARAVGGGARGRRGPPRRCGGGTVPRRRAGDHRGRGLHAGGSPRWSGAFPQPRRPWRG